MKKLLFCIACVVSFPAHAADPLNKDIQKSLTQTQTAMEESVAGIEQQMQQMMPVVADNISQMMQNFFQTIPPLMKSLEDNRFFSQTAKELNQEINAQTAELRRELSKKTTAQPQTKTEEEFVIAGSRNDNGKKLNFNFSQNTAALKELQQAFDIKTSPDGGKTFSLRDLNNRELPGSGFKLRIINGQNYLFYDDGTNYCYVTGIINGNIILRLLATGENAAERARAFVRNSNRSFSRNQK